jgi:hypothetical protein
MIAGALYCVAARGLTQCPQKIAGPSVVPKISLAAGVGLIGSGYSSPILWLVSRPLNGPPDGISPPAPTRAGTLHNLCAIPIFAGIPIAALTCAGSAAGRREYRWAGVSDSNDYCDGQSNAWATMTRSPSNVTAGLPWSR